MITVQWYQIHSVWKYTHTLYVYIYTYRLYFALAQFSPKSHVPCSVPSSEGVNIFALTDQPFVAPYTLPSTLIRPLPITVGAKSGQRPRRVVILFIHINTNTLRI